MSRNWTKEGLLETSASFLISRILISAAELNLFSKVREQPRSAEDLSGAEGWDIRGLQILMDALAANGLLSRSVDGLYGVPEELSDFLISGGEDSVLPMILHRGRMWESWSRLTEVVKTGKPPNPLDMNTPSDEETDSFIGAMHVVGRMTADRIVASLDLSGVKRMLDVGGGAGTYIMAFLKGAPQLQATLFDLPHVIKIAEAQLTKDGFAHRVTLAPGDYHTDDLPTGFDLVLLSAVIHSNGREQNRALLKKVHQSLEPGGTVVLRDFFLDATRTFPPDGAVFAVNMLVATTAGTSYTFDETREDLEFCGFHNIRMAREGMRMDQLVTAVK